MKKNKAAKKEKNIESLVLMTEASDKTRRNVAGVIERTDRFSNIQDGLVPFKESSKQGSSTITVRDAVVLCQKAYYNFSVFRNVIDLMTELSTTDIFFKGGNEKSRSFFHAFFKKINSWDLQDRFYREYYRSGNVFVYRFEATLKTEDVNRITQVYGAEESQKVLPIKYVILNPADIALTGTINFSSGIYSKILSDYELARLRKPQTEEDEEFLSSLPKDVKQAIQKNINLTVLIPLTADNVVSVFYKKQDYEPFAVPMGFPVLEDLNAKYEMKKIDMALARTMQQVILLVTCGTEPEKGGVNPKNVAALQKLFENQSVGRVLIADYTTKAEFIIPKIGELLDAKKYEVINNDINVGLNNVFAGGEKFANQTAKVEIFVSRLRQARSAFVNNFLAPEIKKISKTMGFKNYPVPYLEEIDLKDDGIYAKIYTRLAELGILTSEETIKAIETNRLPDHEESLESQDKFKKLKNEGLYTPLIGGSQKEEKKPGDSSGRPSGSKGIPKSTNKVSPIGASEVNFSVKKIRENLILGQRLEDEVTKTFKKKSKLKKIGEAEAKIIEMVTHTIMANESPEKWADNVEKYCESPTDNNKARLSEINEIAATHNLDFYLATILFNSKI
jgi:hypothetical protein